MARSGLVDPLTKFRWTMDIPGFSKSAFTKCSTPSLSITPKNYPEGGQHWAPKSIPDKFEYQPIVLTRGVTNDTSFNKWATAIVDVYTNGQSLANDSTTTLFGFVGESAMSAVASDVNLSQNQKTGKITGTGYRKDIRIDHVNRAGQVEVSYFIYGAYPIGYKPGSDFDAMADDALSIDTLTLAYDSFEVKYSGIAGFVGGLVADALLG